MLLTRSVLPSLPSATSRRHPLFLAAVIACALTTTAFAQTWTAVPLPPGAAQIGSGGNQLERAGAFPLATTNSGANLWRLLAGNWTARPLPPGVTQLGTGGSRLENSGVNPLATTNFGANLWELVAVTWSPVPLPPGVTQLGAPAADLLPAGARPIAYTNFGTSLWELVGGTWNAIPLPPGAVVIDGVNTRFESCGSQRPLASTNAGANLWEFSAGVWNAVPLPTGVLQLSAGIDQIEPAAGRPGADPLASTMSGLQLFRLQGGSWQSLPLPPGVSQLVPGVAEIEPSGTQNPLASSNSGANLWELVTTVYPGTGEDVVLATGVNGPATHGGTADIKSITSGDLLTITLQSPNTTQSFAPVLLVGEFFVTGGTAPFNAFYSTVHVDTVSSFVILSPAFAAGTGIIGGGITLNYLAGGLPAGVSLMLQAIVVNAATANGIFAATDGLVLDFM